MTCTAIPADRALYGLEDRVPGSPCRTPCEPGCEYTCHERHAIRPAHDQFYCDQIRIGRDVSEYRPDIRRWWEAEKHAARVRAEQGLRGVLGNHDGGWGD